LNEKLYRELISRMAKMQIDVFTSPPHDMLDFNRRLGAWLELKLITDKMADDAKGIEKD
jgi:hypothetical protein